MLDANLNKAGTFQIGFSLSATEPQIFIAEDFDEWISRGLSSDWSASWTRPKREFTHFKHVGRYVRASHTYDTDFLRYCVLAAIAEFERIKRVLAYDLDLIAAARFDQTWVNGHLSAVTFHPLDVVRREAAGRQQA